MGIRKFRKQPPQVAIDVYNYIKENPGTTAGMIARDLGLKHRNYAHQVISSFENYDGLLVSQDDNFRFYPFDIEKLDNNGWII